MSPENPNGVISQDFINLQIKEESEDEGSKQEKKGANLNFSFSEQDGEAGGSKGQELKSANSPPHLYYSTNEAKPKN